jgi:hypothetical protein
VTAVGWAVGQLKHLSALDLRATACDWDAIVRLETFLAKSKLKELDVSRNPLGDAGARACAPLATHKTLIYLDLSHAHIGCDGIQAIAEKMASGSRLQVLLLAHNRIQRQGTEAIARLLPDTRLVHLSLSGNPGPAVAVNALAAALARCRGLRVLELASCGLSETDAAEIIAAALSSPSPLEHLDLRNNQLSASGPASKAYAHALQVRAGLRIHGMGDESEQSEENTPESLKASDAAAMCVDATMATNSSVAESSQHSASVSAGSSANRVPVWSVPLPRLGRRSRSPARAGSPAGTHAQAHIHEHAHQPSHPLPTHANAAVESVRSASVERGSFSPPVARQARMTGHSAPMVVTDESPIHAAASSPALFSQLPENATLQGPPPPASPALSLSLPFSAIHGPSSSSAPLATPNSTRASAGLAESRASVQASPSLMSDNASMVSPSLSSSQHSGASSPALSAHTSARSRGVKFVPDESERATRSHHRSYSPTPPPSDPSTRAFMAGPAGLSYQSAYPARHSPYDPDASPSHAFALSSFSSHTHTVASASFAGLPKARSPSPVRAARGLPHPSGVVPSYHAAGLARDAAGSPIVVASEELSRQIAGPGVDELDVCIGPQRLRMLFRAGCHGGQLF